MMVRFWLSGLLLLASLLSADDSVKVVVVTGASSGIGKSLVEVLAADKAYKVYGTTRQADLVGDYKGYSLVRMDPASTESVNVAMKAIGDRESKIDVLVNNAAYMVLGSVESVDPDQLLDMLNVNVVGYARATRAVLPYMRQQKSGLVVNMSSSQAFEPRGLMESYSATRSAIETLSLGQSAYLEDYGVKVVVFEPGATNTNIGRNAVSGSVSVQGDTAGAKTERLRNMMLDRLEKGASSKEVAERIVDVITDESPDFRTPVDVKVLERAWFVYRDPEGNELRDKLRGNYLYFLKTWGSHSMAVKSN
ncbi:SDR family NAD(P)-dependent oxidoreductase [Endozoicomonas montiporae]|uniref:Short chain dehydrogenase/reductase n=1 Tax=Endozoicomonas montiporae CL-33 TaxID=570277 RepID=A0A142BFU9_9GAMM|nr:SDR family NAD(P)-dependent oxidoreductase [Endozoicomonas montiporae]AMO57625.1 short chain dehydrogenase/reductase [Endozoicomonas montiporae CL-33]